MDKLELNKIDTLSTEEIMYHFEQQLAISQGMKITPEQRVEIITILCKHPIIKVLCTCLEEYGYDNF